MNSTLKFMLPLWVENIAHNSGKLRDITEADFSTARDATHVVIEGGGPSAAVPEAALKWAFVVGNQTTVGRRTDMVVVTDGQLAAAERLSDNITFWNDDRAAEIILAMATIAHPACRTMGFKTYGFVHTLHNPGDDPVIGLVNEMMDLKRGSVFTFMLQVGCSMNAAVLIVWHLMRNGKIPKMPIYLMGVDYAFKDPSDVPSGTDVVLSDRGKLTTDQYLRYARELNTIVHGNPDMEIYCRPAPWNLTSEFIEEKELP